MAKKFKHDERAALARDGYRPRSINGVVTAQVEPPAGYTPAKHESTVNKLGKKKDK